MQEPGVGWHSMGGAWWGRAAWEGMHRLGMETARPQIEGRGWAGDSMARALHMPLLV
jgi:hypothetical protein